MAMPALVLALLLAAVIGVGLWNIIIVIAVIFWASYARIVRGETMAVKELDYIALAKVTGCGRLRIMLTHILPNVAPSLCIMSTLQLGTAIIAEASLSFLGLGVQPPTAAWGLMLADGRTYIIKAWWLAFFPGLAITLTVLGTNLMGDWLRDHLDPKRRQV
jgi:peptide/nickel transport system permease protein